MAIAACPAATKPVDNCPRPKIMPIANWPIARRPNDA